MSSVRMCDRCNRVFNENEDDWTTFSGVRFRKDENGRRVSEQVIQDACSECTKSAFQSNVKVIESGKEDIVDAD